MNRTELEPLFQKHSLGDFRWIAPEDIIVEEWVRFKCTWGCDAFGTKANCPPNTPAIDECRKFIHGYSSAAIFHFSKVVPNKEERHEWTREINQLLLALERSVFLLGFYKAFALYADNCRICPECTTTREECSDKARSRPAADALGVDVFATVRKTDFPIEVLTDPDQEINRYSFLLIE
jgi:predicted metal-binding protein